MVKVIVGDETLESTWYIHRALATKRSAYFRAALSGNFVESNTNEVKLSEDDNPAFGLFVQWLYSTLHKNQFNSESLSSATSVDTLVKAYYLAVKLDADPLGEAVITKLYNKSSLCQELKPNILEYAWDNSLPTSPLTELLIDTVAYNMMNRQIHVTFGENENGDKRSRDWKDLVRHGGDLVVNLIDRMSADWLGEGIRPLSTYLGKDAEVHEVAYVVTREEEPETE